MVRQHKNDTSTPTVGVHHMNVATSKNAEQQRNFNELLAEEFRGKFWSAPSSESVKIRPLEHKVHANTIKTRPPQMLKGSLTFVAFPRSPTDKATSNDCQTCRMEPYEQTIRIGSKVLKMCQDCFQSAKPHIA